MRHTTPEHGQMNRVFDSGYVPERHIDETQRHLPLPEHRAAAIATLWLLFFIIAAASVCIAKFDKVVGVATAWLSLN
jgi:hypothetical protein